MAAVVVVVGVVVIREVMALGVDDDRVGTAEIAVFSSVLGETERQQQQQHGIVFLNRSAGGGRVVDDR